MFDTEHASNVHVKHAVDYKIYEHHWCQTLGAVRFIVLTIFINSGTHYYNIIIRIRTYVWCVLIHVYTIILL